MRPVVAMLVVMLVVLLGMVVAMVDVHHVAMIVAGPGSEAARRQRRNGRKHKYGSNG